MDPRINRWTGKPHEHRREVSRRLRQQQRKEEKDVKSDKND